MEDIDLREILRTTAERVTLPTEMPRPMRRRVALRRARTIAVTLLMTIAVAVGGLQGIRALTLDSAAIGPAQPGDAAPKVDYVLDLRTGERRPLPEAIIGPQGDQSDVLPPGGYAVSPDGSLLAYVRNIGNRGSYHLFIAGIDGTGVRQVTHDPIEPREPTWSPDGTTIAYTARLSRADTARLSSGLFVLDVATGESTQITDEGFVEGPQFTPDGSSLLYTDSLDERPVLRTVPVTGGKSTRASPRRDAENGSLSPDGSLVTFISGQEENGDLRGRRWVANADGTERRSLPNCALNPAGAWSPDGSRIVCVSFDSGSVVVIDIATRQMREVAPDGEGAIWLDDHSLLIDV